MNDPEALLAAYDDQLRVDTISAVSVTRHGPLHLVTYGHGRGYVTYGGIDGMEPGALVDAALEHFIGDEDINRVEWKTRGHDHAPGLHDALAARDFRPGETEAIMIGEASRLVLEVALPDEVSLRQIRDPADVRTMCEMQDEVYDEEAADEFTDALTNRLALDEEMEIWVAEAKGQVIGAGRLEPVRDSDFAGIWGGLTRPEWRGRGVYRALTAVRARSALARGRTLIQSDSTDFSRPILERAGLVKVSTTTPYEWRRDRG